MLIQMSVVYTEYNSHEKNEAMATTITSCYAYTLLQINAAKVSGYTNTYALINTWNA